MYNLSKVTCSLYCEEQHNKKHTLHLCGIVYKDKF